LGAALRCIACGAVTPVANSGFPPRNSVCLPDIAPDGVLAGRYRLARVLRDDGVTRCLHAEHVYLNHPCVVKLLRATCELPAATVAALRAEVDRGFRTGDRHIVRLLDCDVAARTWYFVSEWVDGLALDVVAASRTSLPWRQVVQIGIDAARGLAAIHSAALVHAGVKPGNLLLNPDGNVRIGDFGIERVREVCRSVTAGGTARALGDAYAAPELAWPGGKQSAASDLYSLGVTLYQLALGRLPTGGARPMRQLLDQQFGRVDWSDEAAERLPAELRDLLDQLLRPDPSERPRDAGSVAEALAAISGVPHGASATFVVEDPAPRGVGVLPFASAGHATGDDWLGYALATGVARRLAELPGTYIADVDGFVSTIKRANGEGSPTLERILAAGRLVGAASVLSGRVHCTGDRLRVTLEILREGEAPMLVGSVVGAVSRLPQVEQEITRQFARALGVRAAARTPPQKSLAAPIPAARERLVRARQLYLNGDYHGASRLALEAIGLDPEYADAIGFLGVCSARVGQFAEAERQHAQHLALAERRQDDRQRMEALANLGVMYYFRGDFSEAEKNYRAAADLAHDLGLPVDHAHISNNLGFVLLRRMRLEDAEAAFKAAIETHRAYGALAALVGPYSGVGNVLTEQRRYAEARTYYRRALALASQIGDRTSVGTTHMHLGRCAALEGRYDDAKRDYAVAIGLLDDTGFWSGLARVYEFMIEMNMSLGAVDEAVRCADERIAIARRSNSAALETVALRQKAELLTRAGRIDEAERCLAMPAAGAVAGAA
jgi:tetratricopeptide (TPR) repeat protein